MNQISTYTAQQIADAVKDVCGHDINFISTDGIIIASTNPKRIGDYHAVAHQAAKQKETLEVYEDNRYDGAQRGVNIPFEFHGETMAVIGITGDPEEVRKYAHLALRIMRLLLRERDLEASKEVRRAEFSYIARALLHEETLNPDYLDAFLNQQNMETGARCRVVLLHMEVNDRASNVTAFENRIESVLGSLKESFFAYDYPARYFLIISDSSYLRSRKELQELASEEVRIAVGSAHRLERASRSYRTATLAMKARKQSFCEFESLDIELLFADLSEPAAELFLNRTIAALSPADRHLLDVYFESGLSLKISAKQLFIHKNTLQYQLNRIARLTGRDPRVFRDAVSLYTALKLASSR